MSLLEFCVLASLGTLTAAGASHGYQRLRRVQAGPEPVTVTHYDGCDRPAPGAWHEPRQYPRHQLTCRIEYIYGDLCATGTLIDVSRQGWRVDGQRRVARGTVMSVNIFLPNLPMPVMIDKAVARWTHGLEFGLALMEMAPGEAARLSEYLNLRFPREERKELPVLPYSYQY